MPRVSPNEKSIRATRRFLKILNVYFWIHGLGLPSEFGSRCCRRRLVVFASTFLAVFFEGNMMYVTYLVLRKYEVSDSENLVRVAVLIAFNGLTLLQRYFLCSRNRSIDEILARVVRLYSRIPDVPNYWYAIFAFLIVGDIFLMVILILFLVTLTHNSLYGIMEASLSDSLVYLAYFCVFWKNTGHCAATLFSSVCFLLKWVFSLLENVRGRTRVVRMYNEAVDIAKTANEVFHPAILATLAECLAHVFQQSFNLLYSPSGSAVHFAYKVLYAVFNYLRFVVVCVSASSATAAALEAKYKIYGTKEVVKVTKVRKYDPTFTILDSIIIDRSLVLSASGILLTYGVMIATFSESSKNS